MKPINETKKPTYKPPSGVPCRICGDKNGLHAITHREKGLIVFTAVCGRCKQLDTDTRKR